ncbi:hypothetical protein P280DRAFT_469672 [Massarina eburnea CBS 473.64]|uniref:Kinetochore protein mis14 n=1 Tax=Massarina eburnea CBS 473.64 TaxID=1395130 RepID=A0A6A6RX59_9PLEO|nr:hypothetical protein P280DRAFT_469672 [Massarina eburnea CBS 473.64]
MNAEHRKIELQSPADLSYLATKIRTAARKKLDLHLPTQSHTNEPDELRRHVESLVDTFVAQVLVGMKHNISINGIDVVSREQRDGHGKKAMDLDSELLGLGDGVAVPLEVEEFEPFDEKLRAQLSAAVQKRDALISKISAHRRSTPSLAAQTFQSQFEKEGALLEAQRAEAELFSVENAGKEAMAVESLKRQADVERSWERAVQGLGRLNGGLPESRARLERCQDVVRYLS